MRAEPKRGLNNIILGMSTDDVRRVWGHPSDIDRFTPLEDRPENYALEWTYDPGVILSFDSDEQFLLSDITIESENVFLCDVQPVGMPVKE